MKRLWLAGIGLLVLAALIQFPAAWIAPRIGSATHDQWRVAAVQGTIWHGSGTLYADDRSSGRWLPGRGFRWRLAWTEIPKGRLAAQIDFDDGGTAKLSAGIQGWSLERFDASMPAAQMATLLPSALGDYGWSGTLSARGGTFGCNWGRPICTGQIELSWKGAGTRQIPGPALGDYRLRLTAEGEALRFDLGTERGRLQIAGSGEFSSGKMRFSGEASASGEDSARLDTVLRAVGRPGPTPGHYLIEYRETLASSG